MRHSLLIYVLIALAFAGCATTTTAPTADFAALEKQLMDALADKNYAQLESMLASDFTNIKVRHNPNEPIGSRESWMTAAKSRSWPRYDVSDVKVKQHGNSALVHAVLTAEHEPGVITDRGGRLWFTVSDTWVWKDGRWQLSNRHASLRQ